MDTVMEYEIDRYSSILRQECIEARKLTDDWKPLLLNTIKRFTLIPAQMQYGGFFRLSAQGHEYKRRKETINVNNAL
jgi:hypothetical protein